jgi:hypothetical protein
MRILAVVATLLCWGVIGYAADPVAEGPTLHVAARPQTGPERTLASDDFVVRLNGRDAPVLNAKTPKDGQMILIVLDLAEDLTDAQAAKDALVTQIGKLPDSTYVALMRAQDGPTVLVDPTSDRTVVADAIQNSPVTGKAGLLDSLVSIETLADKIARAANVRVAILYVTDSSVGNYREDFANPVINSSDAHDLSRRFPQALIEEKIQKLETEIWSRETPLFITHLKYNTQLLSAAYQSGLKRLAEGTAGSSTFCATTAEIPEAIEQAFQDISSQYMLTVGLPENAPATVQIHLEATQDSGEMVYRGRMHLKPR